MSVRGKETGWCWFDSRRDHHGALQARDVLVVPEQAGRRAAPLFHGLGRKALQSLEQRAPVCTPDTTAN